MKDFFANETYGKVALEKLSPVPENFRLYEVGWIDVGGHPSTWDTMEVKGAVFREAKRGPRKGQMCIIVEGTKRTAFVTRKEMKAYEEANTPEYSYEVNHCQCHPETCGCNPYKIVDREGNKLTTAFSEEQAQNVIAILNKPKR